MVPPLVTGLLVVIVIVPIVWISVRQVQQAAKNFRQLAATLGLQPEEGAWTGARAFGERRGKRVDLFNFTTGSGKSSCRWSAVTATVPAATTLIFHLRRQGFGTKFLEIFGAREISVGDAEFDRTWFIQTNQPEFLREALLPELREKISSLVSESGAQARGMEFKLENNAVRYAEMGSFASDDICQRCARAVDIVSDLADVAEVFAEQRRGG